MALTHTPTTDFGTPCPDFQLPGVDGRQYSRRQYQDGHPLLVMFICNHCPYVKAIEDRLITLGRDLTALGVHTVAISANDAKKYPEDSFESMQARAKEKAYSFPYLYDGTQMVARSFGAVCTPDFFLYDQDLKLAYRGRLDDSWKDPALVTQRELFSAAEELARTNKYTGPQTPSMGCSIKWTPEGAE